MKLATIVLAAGKSSRMGENKLLLPVGDRTVLEHIISNLEPYEIIVVTGHRPGKIKELSESMGARVVHNPQYEEGMTTSFQVGLRSIDVDAVFLVLGDSFGFNQKLLQRMEQTLEDNPQAMLVSPRYKGRKGHPVLIRKPLFKEFLSISEKETMKTVIERHNDKHLYVEGDEWTVTDMDTKKDYDHVKELWKQKKTGFS